MTIGRLAVRGVVFYRRTYAAVAFGVATAVAVIAGALLVGHSVRASLADVASRRIGRANVIVSAEYPFGAGLCSRLSARLQSSPDQCAAVLELPGTIEHEDSHRRASSVQVFGVDRSFFAFHGVPQEPPVGDQVLLSPDLATELQASAGDTLLVRVQRLSEIPVDSLHARKDEGARAVRAQFHSALDRTALGEFSPAPTQGPIRTVFFPLDRLQRDLGQPERANLILLAGTLTEPAARRALQSATETGDLGVRITSLQNSLVVESATGMLPDAIAHAVESFVRQSSLRPTPVLTWLANRMTIGDASVPYSLVTAIGPDAAGDDVVAKALAAPDGGDPPIVLTEWAARDLLASNRPEGRPTLELEYFEWTDEGQLLTRRHSFRVAGVVPLTGLAIDRRLAPDYPGITDTNSLLDWDPPFAINLQSIRPIDDEYWRKYRTAPKAFIPIEIGQSLWRTRHGALTSIRLTPPAGVDPSAAAARLAAELPGQVDPLHAGFNVVDIRGQNLQAAAGATDFATYFASFSLFLMISSLVLTTLFFRLAIEQRLSQVGVLRAIGFSLAQIRRLFVLEGLLVAAAGAIAGAVLAVGWGALMMYGLRTWWVDAVGTTLLRLHIDPTAIVAGVVAAIVVATVSLTVTVGRLRRASPRELLSGAREVRLSRATPMAAWIAATGAGLAGGLCVLAFVRMLPQEAGFFGAGTVLLLAGLAALRAWLTRSRAGATTRRPALAVRNAGWRPGRSLTAAGLMAAATFLIVSVDSFRQSDARSAGPSSGTGGFALIAEAAVPFVHDLATAEGREALGLIGSAGSTSLDAVSLFPLRLRAGDDASCLNLYQPRRPRVVGVSDRFIDANRFSFDRSVASTDAERANPWRLLQKPSDDGAVPVIVDATSLQYVLHASVGGVIEIDRDTARPARLRIVASLANSMLQSELLISEAAFLRMFPDVSGYRLLLVEGPTDEGLRSGRPDLAAIIEERLEPFGVDAQKAAERLAAYHRVENTYLSTFQALGGLGLLLGTFGLAAISSRNILERRKELAFLRAAGFTGRQLRNLILTEHAIVLAGGLAVGAAAALLAISPVVASRGTGVHVMPFVWILIVAVSGLVVIAWTTRSVRRMPLVESLRTE